MQLEDVYISLMKKPVLKPRVDQWIVLVLNAIRRKLNAWQNFSNRDGHVLQTLSDFLKNCLMVMKASHYLKISYDPQKKKLQKLSPAIIDGWNSTVYRWFASDAGYPLFSFCEFIEMKAKKACLPISSWWCNGNEPE